MKCNITQTKMKKRLLKILKKSALLLLHLPLLLNGRIIRNKPSSAYKKTPYVRPLSRKVAGDRLDKVQSTFEQLTEISDKVLVYENNKQDKEYIEFELFGQFVTSQLHGTGIAKK